MGKNNSGRKRSWTDTQLMEAVKNSKSYRGVLRYLGLNDNGGGMKSTIGTRMDELKMDYSHFTGQGWGKGRESYNTGIPPEDVLVKDSTYLSTNNLKKKLFRFGIFEQRCYECGITEWNGKKAPLALHHINGIRNDNRKENLTILCSNCHAQTETYCGKNKGVNGGSTKIETSG